MPDGIFNGPKYEQTPDGVIGFSNVDSFPTQHVDAFSRLRVSAHGYRFDSQLTYQIDSDLWDSSATNGTIAHSATERWAELTATASTVSQVVLQSHYHAPYTPGRSQLALITFVLGAAPATGGYKRVGYGDGSNGICLERSASGVSLKNAATTSHGNESVEQASWNIDPFDGSGPSELTIDWTKTQIMVVSLQALYVGRVIVGFDINGEIYPAHQFTCANVSAYPYIAQASLPVRYEVGGTADTGSDVVMHAICATVISEGGNDIADMPGRSFPAYGSMTSTASGTLIVVRAKSQLNSINSHVVAIPTDLDVSVAGAGCWINVRRNATVTAGTFTDVATASAYEASFAGNAGTDPAINTGTGDLIDRFWVPASGASRTSSARGLTGKLLLAYSHILASGDTISIDYDGGTASTDVSATIKWREIR